VSSSDGGTVSVSREDLALVMSKPIIAAPADLAAARRRLRAVLDAPSEPEGPPSPISEGHYRGLDWDDAERSGTFCGNCMKPWPCPDAGPPSPTPSLPDPPPVASSSPESPIVTAADTVSLRDTLSNLITTHRGRMDDPNWLTHIELADLMLQAFEIEGWTVIKVGALEHLAAAERQGMIALLRAEHALRTIQEFFRHRTAPADWPADLLNGAQGQAKVTLDAFAPLAASRPDVAPQPEDG
jgi:hypothetical protein